MTAHDSMNLSITIKQNWTDLWSLDHSALAMSRICLSIILVFDLLQRLTQAEMLYGANAMAPHGLIEATVPVIWRLYLLSESLWFSQTLIVLTIISALCWMTGYRGRWPLFVTWFLYTSLFYRNSFIHSGAEPTLIAALFWMLWLPHTRLRLFNFTHKAEQTRSNLSPGSVAFVLHVAVYYFFSGLHKSDPIWWQEGSALHYALNLDALVSDAGRWLLTLPEITKALSISIWWLEMLSPLVLLVVPLIFGSITRTIIVLLLIGLHIGIAIFLEIGTFPYINIAILIALLPISSVFAKPIIENTTNPFSNPKNWLLLSVASLLIGSQISHSLLRFKQIKTPTFINALLQTTSQKNPYRFFAPKPPLTERFWFFQGTLVNGNDVNVYDYSLEPLVMDKTYAIATWNRFHRQYFLHFERSPRRAPKLRAQFAKWLCWRWQQHGDLPILQSVNLRYQQEWSPGWQSNKASFIYNARGYQYECERSLE